MIGGRSALLGAASGLGYENWSGDYSNVTLLLRGAGTPVYYTPVDESSTPKTITRVGAATASTSTYKFGGSSLSFSDSGANDRLTTSSLGLGSANFTIEFWLYANSIGITRGLLSIATSSGYMVQLTLQSDGTIRQAFGGGPQIVNTAVLSAGQWYHIALTRSGGTFYLFVNGVAATFSSSGTIPATTTVIGNIFRGSYGNPLDGFIDDLRITNGVARYTSNFTPPSAELPASLAGDPSYNSVSLLLRGANTPGPLGPIDESLTPKTLTLSGSVIVNTTTFRYGTSSISFDGSSYASSPLNSGFDFGTGDFTIECWINLNSLATNQAFISYAAGTSAGTISFSLDRLSTGAFRVLVYSGSTSYIATLNPTISTGAWYHVAGVRNSSQLRCFVNGVGGSSVSANVSINTAASRILTIGSLFTSSSYVNGFMDDIRITKGIARYTKNFLPPPAELPNV